jgi:hypothetical protein
MFLKIIQRSSTSQLSQIPTRKSSKLMPWQDWMTVSWVHKGPSYGQLPAEVRQLNELARESDRFRSEMGRVLWLMEVGDGD